MDASPIERTLGVFASLDAGLGVRWDVLERLHVPTMHLHAPHDQRCTPEVAKKVRVDADAIGVQTTVVFAGFEGESYASIPEVAETIGLVPAATREQRTAELRRVGVFADAMNCDAVGMHVGVLPHDRDHPDYRSTVDALSGFCSELADRGQFVHLETGQETADALLAFIADVGADNLRINFDPANLILYGMGDPIESLGRVSVFVRSVHCKDATPSDSPGKIWGCEVPLGEGDVDMTRYLRTLDQIGYRGPLTIEREIPQEPDRQEAEIRAAMRTLTEASD